MGTNPRSELNKARTDISYQIFEKLKVGWNKLVDFISFISSWDDIIDIKNTISSLLSVGFEYAAIKVDDLAGNVDGFFEGMEKTINNLGKDNIPSKSLTEDDGEKKEEDDGKSSTSSSWVGERLKNGGAGQNTKIVAKGLIAHSQSLKPSNKMKKAKPTTRLKTSPPSTSHPLCRNSKPNSPSWAPS